MVDIHCHILPGLDDGPDSIEESIQMAQAAIADGITHIVATPHANDTFRYDLDTNLQRRDELQARIGTKLTLATGCDFHLSYENILALRQNPMCFTLNQKNYVLVEFPEFAIPPAIDETLMEMVAAGIYPIITHPERTSMLRASRERVKNWVHQGCCLQLTAQSILGRFGQGAQRAAEAWLDDDGVHFIASDAHDVASRPPRLREAFDVVARRKGPEVAQALFRDNPLAALEGRALPYVPELAESASRVQKRKRFLFF
jgi:protein-tyrosine phosphatase